MVWGVESIGEECIICVIILILLVLLLLLCCGIAMWGGEDGVQKVIIGQLIKVGSICHVDVLKSIGEKISDEVR